MDDIAQRSVIAAVLAWHEAMGVDAAVTDDAIDWLSRTERPPGTDFNWPERGPARGDDTPAPQSQVRSTTALRPSLLTTPAPLPPLRPQSPAITRPAKPSASTPVNARSLKDLEAEIGAFDGCGLKATATKLCFYRGAERARLMIIGEAPGRDEDLEGKPFVGRAGQLLDRMLAAIDLTNDDVHITNVVYWRPPGNRTPAPAETLACAPFLSRQIELVAPDVILLLGAVAAKQILDATDAMNKLRGNWFETSSNGRTIKTMASWHPAYLLRTPAAKRQAWRDLLALKAQLLLRPTD